MQIPLKGERALPLCPECRTFPILKNTTGYMNPQTFYKFHCHCTGDGGAYLGSKWLLSVDESIMDWLTIVRRYEEKFK